MYIDEGTNKLFKIKSMGLTNYFFEEIELQLLQSCLNILFEAEVENSNYVNVITFTLGFFKFFLI
jgi:hypothetical protein